MKILIIEDEPQIACELRDILLKINPEARIIAILDSIDTSVDFLLDEKNVPELIFMDIQLADGLSFEIFSRTEINCPVVFCTAYDQYKLQAFKCNGIDYILKPVTEYDIRAVFEKIKKLKQSFKSNTNLNSVIQNIIPQQRYYAASILVQNKKNHIPIDIHKIALFFLKDDIVSAYCFNNKILPLYKSLEELEYLLNPNQFYRINSRIILNRASIKEIQPYINKTIAVKTGLKFEEDIIVSQLKTSAFLKWVEQPVLAD
jgi:two-component system, LytTR family, response regulator LytT